MILRDGDEYFEDFATPLGSISALADVHFFGDHVVFDELTFYPTDSRDPLPVGVGVMLAIVRHLRRIAKEQGFAKLTVGFHRVGAGQARTYNNFHQEPAMKTSQPRTIDPAISHEIVLLLESGQAHEDVIERMRTLGLYKIECIRMMRMHGGLSLHDAKDLVHLSSAWANVREADEAFHDAAEAALEIARADERTAA